MYLSRFSRTRGSCPDIRLDSVGEELVADHDSTRAALPVHDRADLLLVPIQIQILPRLLVGARLVLLPLGIGHDLLESGVARLGGNLLELLGDALALGPLPGQLVPVLVRPLLEAVHKTLELLHGVVVHLSVLVDEVGAEREFSRLPGVSVLL